MTVKAQTDLGELIELPNGTRLYYVDADHAYWRCKDDGGRGKRLTGISTVSGPFDFRPDGLLAWVERLTLEGVARAFAGREVPSDPHVLRANLQSSGLRWEQLRDEAADRGTSVHMEILHALAAGDDVPPLDRLPEEHRGYGQAIMAWWVDREPEVLQAEQVVLSDEHGFAGRLDLRCRVHRGVLAPELWVVDAKTGGFIPTKAHAQLAGYDLGATLSGLGEAADRLVILQLREDGTYRELTAHATHKDFLNGLAVYRGAGRINNAARKDRVPA